MGAKGINRSFSLVFERLIMQRQQRVRKSEKECFRIIKLSNIHYSKLQLPYNCIYMLASSLKMYMQKGIVFFQLKSKKTFSVLERRQMFICTLQGRICILRKLGGEPFQNDSFPNLNLISYFKEMDSYPFQYRPHRLNLTQRQTSFSCHLIHLCM